MGREDSDERMGKEKERWGMGGRKKGRGEKDDEVRKRERGGM